MTFWAPPHGRTAPLLASEWAARSRCGLGLGSPRSAWWPRPSSDAARARSVRLCRCAKAPARREKAPSRRSGRSAVHFSRLSDRSAFRTGHRAPRIPTRAGPGATAGQRPDPGGHPTSWPDTSPRASLQSGRPSVRCRRPSAVRHGRGSPLRPPEGPRPSCRPAPRGLGHPSPECHANP